MFDVGRGAILLAVLAGTGTTLVLSTFPWFRRRSLVDRIATPGNPNHRSSTAAFTYELVVGTLGPSVDRLTRAFGIDEPLERRLPRAGSPRSALDHRFRQAAIMALLAGIGTLVVITVTPPLALSILATIGAPLFGFLFIEQQLQGAIRDRTAVVFAELPVVSEQLAMLLSSGHSLQSALTRIAETNHGVTGNDLRRVCERMQVGVGVNQALLEWADTIEIPEVRRLVTVLDMSRNGGDAGALVTVEAQAIRRESHRRIVETIDKRAQQVWIPVTVATLVPGVIFLLVPFLHALDLFSKA